MSSEKNNAIIAASTAIIKTQNLKNEKPFEENAIREDSSEDYSDLEKDHDHLKVFNEHV